MVEGELTTIILKQVQVRPAKTERSNGGGTNMLHVDCIAGVLQSAIALNPEYEDVIRAIAPALLCEVEERR